MYRSYTIFIALLRSSPSHHFLIRWQRLCPRAATLFYYLCGWVGECELRCCGRPRPRSGPGERCAGLSPREAAPFRPGKSRGQREGSAGACGARVRRACGVGTWTYMHTHRRFVVVFVLFYKSTEPTTAVFCCFCTDNELHSSENFRTNQTYYSALQLHLNCYECIRFPPIFFQVGGRLISNQVGVNIDFEIVFVNQQMFKIVYRRKKILALESF